MSFSGNLSWTQSCSITYNTRQQHLNKQTKTLKTITTSYNLKYYYIQIMVCYSCIYIVGLFSDSSRNYIRNKTWLESLTIVFAFLRTNDSWINRSPVYSLTSITAIAVLIRRASCDFDWIERLPYQAWIQHISPSFISLVKEMNPVALVSLDQPKVFASM